jgi:hypothetical protein
MSEPTLEFASLIDGKDATVRVFEDRVEWSKPMLSAAKVATAVYSFGLTAATEGVQSTKHEKVKSIPMRSIRSVTSKQVTTVRYKVTVIKSSGTRLELRCIRQDAEEFVRLVRDGISGKFGSGRTPTPQPGTVVHAEPTPPPPLQGPPAGWYADAQDPDLERWWDGTRWTDHTQRTMR